LRAGWLRRPGVRDLRHHARGGRGRDRPRDRPRHLPDVRDDRRRRDGPAARMTEGLATTEFMSTWWVALIPLLPLAGAAVLGLFGEALQTRVGKKVVGAIAVGTVAFSFLLSLLAFFRLVGMDEHARAGGLGYTLLPWIHVGSLNVDLAFQIDP